jgi:NAD(P)-dependent dehydrogenase (short-subunit alcohol dehydrogenase family)
MPFYYFILGAIAFIAVAVKAYLKFTTGRFRIKKDLNGKVFLITGPTAGIGKETAKELAQAGANVHMACRNKSKGSKVAKEISKATGNPNVFVHQLDLASLKSVKLFAEKFLATNPKIDVLINNAGMLANIQNFTEDGFDETMQSNYFGHFLLTSLLLDRIKESAPSRIVNVSSLGHLFVENFDITDLNFKHSPYAKSSSQKYTWSKLCNILFTVELAKRLQNTGVTTNSLHPGSISTDLLNNQPFYLWPVIMLLAPFFKTASEGAKTTLYLAVSDEVENVSGYYFSDCKPKETSLTAMDGKLAKDLWSETERLLKEHL